MLFYDMAVQKEHSVKTEEILHFSKDSPQWWDEDGPFAPLHQLNPVRMQYLKTMICRQFGRDERLLNPLGGLKILDIGCGGGLVCEPMARLSAKVTGIDADPNAITTACEHARQQQLDITYKTQSAENIKEHYDVVLALEIVEHVNDPAKFVETCAALLKPGGIIIFSTLNRTLKSLALGIVAAEYILGWVPRGTHNWRQFIRPSEMATSLRQAGLTPHDVTGLIYHPFKRAFVLSRGQTGVNYFMAAIKPAGNCGMTALDSTT